MLVVSTSLYLIWQSFMEEQQNIVPIDGISNFQTNTEENELKGIFYT